jgi:hypothetical protein
MAELLRRGYDAQIADRNTKGYDMLVGKTKEPAQSTGEERPYIFVVCASSKLQEESS